MVGLPKWTKFERKKNKVFTVAAILVMKEFIFGQLPLTKGSMVALS